MPTLGGVVAALDELYDPAWAEPWDAVGLVCGDPDAHVTKILFAVDPIAAVAAEAVEWDADLIVAHHPLFLRGVHGVPAMTPKGKVVHTLLTSGIALHVAHTNADVANPGVSDAFARALNLEPLRPLVPLADASSERGLGRLCELAQPEALKDFVERVRGGLPHTAHGVRVAGDLERLGRTIALAGGAGDGYFDAARAAGADVYVTADLRHHPASESIERGTPALVDVAHWASEWPWLAEAGARLAERLSGDTVETRVSRIITDPWTAHFSSANEPYDHNREQP